MNLLLFVVTILVSTAVVRIGAVAFNLTGVEWNHSPGILQGDFT